MEFPSNRTQYDVHHDFGTVDFYWGVASGTSHAALHDATLNPDDPSPERLMVNHATVNNQLWEGPEWFIDCGGSPDTIKANDGHKTSVSEYLGYLRDPPTKYGDDLDDIEVGRFALRDWPCEPVVREALGATVGELQWRTTRDHIRMMDATDDGGDVVEGDPVAVIQGWEPEDYLAHLDELRDYGLVTDTVGLGTVCGRESVEHVKDVAHRVRRSLPPRVDLHGFGLKKTMLDHPDSFAAFDSVDSAAWENIARNATKDGWEPAPPIDGLDYDDWPEWDDENPRYTGTNARLCYLGYREKIEDVSIAARDEWGADVTVEDIGDWSAVMDALESNGDESDGYTLVKCVCGTIHDPGRPEPIPDPGCRHCERTQINLWDKRLALKAGQ